MDVDQIWLLGTQQFGELLSLLVIPDSLPQKHQSLDPRIKVHVQIIAAVDHNLVPAPLQELALQLDDYVFPSGSAVMTMNEDYLHDLPFPALLP
jgi:hypothetical protein